MPVCVSRILGPAIAGCTMGVEYRLVVDYGYRRNAYLKRDRAHAELGLEHALRDLKLMAANDLWQRSAYVEWREVSDWVRQ